MAGSLEETPTLSVLISRIHSAVARKENFLPFKLWIVTKKIHVLFEKTRR